MRERGVLLPVAAVAAVTAAALLFLFRDTLAAAVSYPLAWIFWVLRSASVLVGQRIVWAVFVLAFAAVSFQSLRALRETPPEVRPQPRGDAGGTRIAHWEGVLALDQGGAAARHVLVLELRRAALTVLAHTEGGDAGGLEQRITSGGIDIPACVRDLFGQSFTAELRGKRRRGRARLVRLPVEEIASALEDRLGGRQADAGRER